MPTSRRARAAKKLDPELLRQLERVALAKRDLQVVVRLRPDKTGQAAPSPQRTQELAESLLERVEKAEGEAPADYNVFQRLGSFVVQARPAFIRRLIAQPEVASAVANRSGR